MRERSVLIMACAVALMVGALMVSFEVGYGDMDHPIMGMIICLIMMWGACRLIGGIKSGKRN